MSCRKVRRLLSAYIDDACSPGERARVDEHVDSCNECSALLGEMQRTKKLVAELPHGRTSDEFMPALVPRLRERQQLGAPGVLRRAMQWLLDSQLRWQAAAAGVAVLVVAVSLVGVLNRTGETPTLGPEVTATATDDYLTTVVERHRRFAATTLPFDDRALIYASYENGT